MNQDLIAAIKGIYIDESICLSRPQWICNKMLMNTRRQSGNVPFAEAMRHQVDAQQRFQEQLEVTRKETNLFFLLLE